MVLVLKLKTISEKAFLESTKNAFKIIQSKFFFYLAIRIYCNFKKREIISFSYLQIE